ncbi:MAG: 4Fe-4S binding protein [Deltaproteobacteria bacterium]|nr:4Fe-4S binding protein [Deltaproteobacteria bacterium]
MGHIVAKDIYRKLGKKIDELPMRAPWNEQFHAILKELFSAEEADVVVRMPYGLSSFNRLARITGIEQVALQKILDDLSSKGLVIDVWMHGKFYYMPSPIAIGIFEFTMMRTGDASKSKEWARLFHEYFESEGGFFGKANFGNDEKISIMRALPHEEAIEESDHLEILDYESAAAIIENADKLSVGLCSCRHEKLHIGEMKCGVPLEKCSTIGPSADYMIRHKFGREASRSEMLESLAQSKEMGLVLNADNVQRNISFICHCCKCCCNALLGISKFGYPNVVVTSNYIATVDETSCTGCGICAKACPIEAIEIVPSSDGAAPVKKHAKIDGTLCLGCGVCALKCKPGALKLTKRDKRVIHPENTFERIILQSLERGVLQYQMFDDPKSVTQKFMRAFVGGFLRLDPVKRALMSDMLRSRFLATIKGGIKKQKKSWMTEV